MIDRKNQIRDAIVLLSTTPADELVSVAYGGYWMRCEFAWKNLREADWILCQREKVPFTDNFDPDSIPLGKGK